MLKRHDQAEKILHCSLNQDIVTDCDGEINHIVLFLVYYVLWIGSIENPVVKKHLREQLSIDFHLSSEFSSAAVDKNTSRR